jgi:hypothetical protein
MAAMGKARRKPTDPQDIARRRAERVANEAEIARLRGMGATVALDRSRRIVSAFRASPFHKLRDSKTITSGQASAVERLCEDWAKWHGLDGRPDHAPVPNLNPSHVTLLTDEMLKAGDRVRRVLDRIGPMDRELLEQMVEAVVAGDGLTPWRGIVARVTGQTQAVRQSAVIVSALENLRRAYMLH